MRCSCNVIRRFCLRLKRFPTSSAWSLSHRWRLFEAVGDDRSTYGEKTLTWRLKRKASDAIRPEVVHADLANVPKPLLDVLMGTFRPVRKPLKLASRQTKT